SNLELLAAPERLNPEIDEIGDTEILHDGAGKRRRLQNCRQSEDGCCRMNEDPRARSTRGGEPGNAPAPKRRRQGVYRVGTGNEDDHHRRRNERDECRRFEIDHSRPLEMALLILSSGSTAYSSYSDPRLDPARRSRWPRRA